MGPLLFNVYINDIVRHLDVNCLLYADDMKIFYEINRREDGVQLLRNLDRVFKWSVHNDLPLNKNISVVMSYSNKCDIIKFDCIAD